MIGKQKEKWMELCEPAANEQDASKMIALITEINRLLEAAASGYFKSRLQGLAKTHSRDTFTFSEIATSRSRDPQENKRMIQGVI
jgi:hypothetical protein